MIRHPLAAALAAALLAACATPTPEPTPPPPPPTATPAATSSAAPQPPQIAVVVAIAAPLPETEPQTGLLASSLARALALGPLSDLLNALDRAPRARVTLALGPALARQLRAMANPEGARDVFWELGSRPVAALTADDRRRILGRFFDGRAAARVARDESVFPRWKELRARRDQALAGGLDQAVLAFTDADFRDLQVLYNLALFDPAALARPPLAGLVARGSGWSEDDKRALFEASQTALAGVVDRLGRMAGTGQIEIAALPFAEAVDVVWQAGAAYPFPADADRLLDAAARDVGAFAGRPAGVVFRAGIVPSTPAQRWMTTSRGWILAGAPAVLSDGAIDGVLTGIPSLDRGAEPAAVIGAMAAATGPGRWSAALLDLDLAAQPEVQSAWLRALAGALGETPSLNAVTIREAREAGRLPAIAASPAPPSPARAMPAADALLAEVAKTRAFVDEYVTGRRIAGPDIVNEARDIVLSATDRAYFAVREGADPDDQQRSVSALLRRAYALLGAPAPDYLDAPLGPAKPARLERRLGALITPTIEGVGDDAQWSGAALVRSEFLLPTEEGDQLQTLRFGLNARSLYVRIDARLPWSTLAEDTLMPSRVGVYVQRSGSGGRPAAAYVTRIGGDGETKRPLGFTATHLIEWTVGEPALALYAANPTGGWTLLSQSEAGAAGLGVGKSVVEMMVPLDALGIESDDRLALAALFRHEGGPTTRLPREGVALATVPDIGTPRLLGRVEDPVGDDHGPGAYVYPLDTVFAPGSFDLKQVAFSRDAADLIVVAEMAAPIRNPWSSPIGLSIQTFDLYIDCDPGRGTGRRELLPGRNAALPAGFGWEAAIMVEGWAQTWYVPDGAGVAARDKVRPRVAVDPRGRVTIRVPLDALPAGDPADWAFAFAVLGQETGPTEAALRVREVDPVAGPWRFGGAPGDAGHTRIIDLLAPPGAPRTQEAALSAYRPEPRPGTADDLPQAPMVTIKPSPDPGQK